MKERTAAILGRRISILFCVCFALGLNLLLEILARKSLVDAFGFLTEHPLRFLIGASIVFITLLLTQLTRRQVFCLTLVTAFWVILGITNSLLLSVRSTPLSVVDLTMAKYAITIWYVYIRPWQMVLIVLAVLGLVGACVYLFIRGPRLEVGCRKRSAALLMASLLFLLICGNALGMGVVEETSADLEEVYGSYGFAYCFSQSFLDQEMATPYAYEEDKVQEVLGTLEDETLAPSSPNILFLQLESFVDLTRVEGLTLSEHPHPNYTALREMYSTGLLTVSTLGGGTIFTEFEILTGMSMEFLGNGAYPFSTIVQETTVDSLAYAFKGLGYTSTAIHNHLGAFYDRDVGYSQLGFDRFTSLEFMEEAEKNENGWAKDAILTGEILRTLRESDGPDYIHTVAVQTHGQYPTEAPERPYPIQVTSDMDEADRYAVEYYASQIAEVDSFLGELINELLAYEEDVVLVIYGDHLPSIESLYNLEEGDRYQTEYILWANFPLERQQRDMATYELGAYVQSRMEISAGIMPRFHQSNRSSASYWTEMEELQYDLLYGEGYAYGEEGKHEPTDIEMGILQPEIEQVVSTEDGVLVIGENFNSYCQIYIDGEAVETVYQSETELVADAIWAPGQEWTVTRRLLNRRPVTTEA